MPLGDPNFLQHLGNWILAGVLGMIGSIASYFYQIDRGARTFTFTGMFFVSAIGFVIGTAAGSFIPVGENWYGWTLVVGINAYPIMAAVKERGGSLIGTVSKLIGK